MHNVWAITAPRVLSAASGGDAVIAQKGCEFQFAILTFLATVYCHHTGHSIAIMAFTMRTPVQTTAAISAQTANAKAITGPQPLDAAASASVARSCGEVRDSVMQSLHCREPA